MGQPLDTASPRKRIGATASREIGPRWILQTSLEEIFVKISISVPSEVQMKIRNGQNALLRYLFENRGLKLNTKTPAVISFGEYRPGESHFRPQRSMRCAQPTTHNP